MEITKELLQTIYNRAEQYYLAKTGDKPERMVLEDDGTVYAYSTDYDGDHIDTEYIQPENLSEDLDAVVQKRLEAEQRRREEQEDLSRQREIERKEKELRERKILYNKLKKEFGE